MGDTQRLFVCDRCPRRSSSAGVATAATGTAVRSAQERRAGRARGPQTGGIKRPHAAGSFMRSAKPGAGGIGRQVSRW